MIILKARLVITGSILLPIFGVISIILLSSNNGVTEELTTVGYGWLAISVFLSLLGLIFIIVGAVSKDSKVSLNQRYCPVCHKAISSDNNFCPYCATNLRA